MSKFMFRVQPVPWVRAMATRRARPVAASQAENARTSIGTEEACEVSH